MLHLIITLFSLSNVLFHSVLSQSCGNISHVMCLNERQFYRCDDEGIIIDKTYYTCPVEGQFCADVPGGCSMTDPKLNLTYCDQCNARGGWACTSLKGYKKCDENSRPIDNTLTTCAEVGTYCDRFTRAELSPCQPFTGQQVFCWKNDMEIINGGLLEQCQGVTGRHAVAEEPCNYINCYLENDVLKAAKLTCPNGQTFNTILRFCRYHENAATICAPNGPIP